MYNKKGVIKIINIYGVKEGDIFCMERSGFSGHHAHFFQVVTLKGKKKIVIKEIDKKEVSRGIVIPIKDSFLNDSSYIKDYIGDTKITKKRDKDDERVYEDSPIYITLSKFYNRSYYNQDNVMINSIYEEAYLWKGKPKKNLLEWLN